MGGKHPAIMLPETLGGPLQDAEREAAEVLATELGAHLTLAVDAFNMLSEVLSHTPRAPMKDLPPSLHVAVKLLLRLSNDLRCVEILAGRGYSVQAMVLAASMFEVAFAVAYIGSDDTLAQEWTKHDDPTRSFRDVYAMTREGLAKLEVDDLDLHARTEYKVYRQLCWAKHANPVLEKRVGIEVVGEVVVSMNGPSTAEDAVKAAWFALEHAVGLAVIAASSFLMKQLKEICSTDDYNRLVRLVDSIGTRRKALESDAIGRWGTEDPFPGKW